MAASVPKSLGFAQSTFRKIPFTIRFLCSLLAAASAASLYKQSYQHVVKLKERERERERERKRERKKEREMKERKFLPSSELNEGTSLRYLHSDCSNFTKMIKMISTHPKNFHY
jgi:polynucleotide 5'-kinase involved in rRNA processing